ncbi:Nectarin-1 [Acorus gramineus]|uniref:Germin-like protein n=1 Tax=Acorus gramineus TaxID=55184 RepID=A0AAV9BXN9_ACOGR|nr:Nectarin-1 [Acorus gramineus]
MKTVLAFLCLSVFLIGIAFAGDPDMLQDLCVADLASGNPMLKVNGFVCKTKANATDFTTMALKLPGNTNNKFRAVVTPANVVQVPGLNTLGVSMARIDYAPGGLNPPHTHPRATEMIFVLEGQLDVGFILIATTIKKGEVFVFPRGLLHFQMNNGDFPAAVIAGFNSQFPGTQQAAAALFNATPPVPDDVLAKAFQIGVVDVEKIKMNLK